MAYLKVPSVAVLVFVLSYFLNPMNDVMHESLTGPFTLHVPIGPGLILGIGKFILPVLVVTLPCLLLRSMSSNRPFLKAGLPSGLVLAGSAVLNFLVYEKSELSARAWFFFVPAFATIYFLLGFAGGGFWGIAWNRYLRP